MGLSLADFTGVSNGIQSILINSINLGDNGLKTPEAPSFEYSLSAEKTDSGMAISLNASPSESNHDRNLAVASVELKADEKACQISRFIGIAEELPILDPSNPKHEAAVKLQKVYKSFRTRRKLADCAVLVEQSWWKLLDFAELKHSSISFFDGNKNETALSRWSRARTRVAKVGKGLSKNDKARKLTIQHWLEAIDPRHRYGHNLHFYYVKWLHSQSREPFFYWLDIGEGKEVNLVEKCPRSKLQQQCIKYLGPMERKAYEVAIEDGKLFYKLTGEPIHTTGEDAKWIFVLSTSRTMYVGKKKKGTFQHSSFLAGGAAAAAGRLVVENGELKAVWPHSGHYRPTKENFEDFISFLQENNVDPTDVKLSPADGNETPSRQGSSLYLRSNMSEEDLMANSSEVDLQTLKKQRTEPLKEETRASERELPKQSRLHSFSGKLTNLEVPKQIESFNDLESENVDGYETAEEPFASGHNCITPKQNLFDDSDNSKMLATSEEESSVRSHEESKPLQQEKSLSCKWTTGAGPRIGYVRDFPPTLQARALEQVNLSPTSAGISRMYISPRLTSAGTPVESQQISAVMGLNSRSFQQEHGQPPEIIVQV